MCGSYCNPNLTMFTEHYSRTVIGENNTSQCFFRGGPNTDLIETVLVATQGHAIVAIPAWEGVSPWRYVLKQSKLNQ